MATAATVTIRLDADSATLIRELNKAEQSTQGSFRKMKAEAASLATGFSVIAGAAAVAFTALTMSSFESIDALAKAADRMGIATEAMRTLQVAADLAGVSQETMNKSLLKQQQAIAKAVEGEKTYADAFKQLHINTQELIKLPVDQQFNVIADALAKVENVTVRNNAALDIFGARAASMINLTQTGALSLGELRKYLDDVNVSVSRFDASKIEQANDSVSLAKTAFEGLGNTIAIAVAPVVTGLAKDFSAAAASANGFKSQVQSAMDGTVTAVKFVANGVQGIGLAFSLVKDVAIGAFSGLAGAIVATMAQVGDLIRRLLVDPILAGFQLIAQGQARLAAALDLEGLAQRSRASAAGVQSLRDSLKGASDAAFDTANNLLGFSGENFTNAWKRTADAFENEWSGSAWERRYQGYVDASNKAAAEAANAIQQANAAAGGLEGPAGPDHSLDSSKTLFKLGKEIKPDTSQLQAPLTPYLDPGFVREATDLATAQYLEGWQLANAQRVEADQAVKDTLLQSDEQAGKFLIELAAQQAREKVIAEFEARGQALGETGQPVDPAARAEFELAIYDETLAREQDFLNQRMALQGRFGQQFITYQQTVTKLFGKQWADTHKSTLDGMSAFAAAAGGIGQALFADNKAAGIANAVVNTYVGVTQALASLPFPANLAAAATVLASGFAQVKAITSTNIGGGSGASGSIGSAPALGAPTSADTGAFNKDLQSDRQHSVQLVFNGDMIGWDDHIQSRVIDGIRSAIEDRDVILFSNSSRQAGELVGP